MVDLEPVEDRLEGGWLGVLLAGAADELGAVVGLHPKGLKLDAVAGQVFDQVRSESGGVGGVVGMSVGDEGGAGAYVPSGVLVARQALGGGRGPIKGDIAEVFDVGL
ncbi:MAG: hypothetical protein ACK44W_12935, partial [Planctomycetota bacterium]